MEAKWADKGAASGILSSILPLAGLLMGVVAASKGTPPDVAGAQSAPAFIASGLTQIRLQGLFTTLGLVLFLWFLGGLVSRLKEAEGEASGAR